MEDSSAATGTRIGQPTPLGAGASFDGGLVEVADRTWAWLQPNGGLGESNAGLVVGEGGSLLVDTLWDAALTARMLEAMAALTEAADAPIATLFNTHGDGDHWYGNSGVAPGVEIIATRAADEQMREEPPALLTRLAPIGPIAGVAARVPVLPGRPQLRGMAAFSAALGCYEFAGLEPRRPDRRFSGSLAIEVGARPVELIEVGPAHTPGDAIAWLADARVAYVGDILFNGVTPIMWTGPVDNWIAALERIAALDPAVVVGGHGPPGGGAEVAAMRSYWTWLRDEVAAAGDERAGRLAERLVRSSAYAAEPWGSWRNPERTHVNVARIQATSGVAAPKPLGTVERIRLIAGMGALAERLG